MERFLTVKCSNLQHNTLCRVSGHTVLQRAETWLVTVGVPSRGDDQLTCGRNDQLISARWNKPANQLTGNPPY